MGYMEPRPNSHAHPNGDQLPSPKDIQKKLMDKVTHLSPIDARGMEGEGEAGATISHSHSSQSLNSNNGSIGSKFGSVFKR